MDIGSFILIGILKHFLSPAWSVAQTRRWLCMGNLQTI